MRPDGEALELVVSHNLTRDYTGTTLRLGEGLSGRVAQTGEPMMVADHRTWEKQAAPFADAPFRRVLGVPLKAGNRVIGVLNVTDTEQTGPFEEEDIQLVSLFADQAAIALENARLHEATQHELTERGRAEEALRLERDFTAGAGLHVAFARGESSLSFVVDYAFLSHELGNTHRISLMTKF